MSIEPVPTHSRSLIMEKTKGTHSNTTQKNNKEQQKVKKQGKEGEKRSTQKVVDIITNDATTSNIVI